MNTTKIEWTDYTWNPVTGCLNHVNGLCKGGGFPCYAWAIANRFKGTKAWPNGFYLTYHPNRIDEPFHHKEPSKIFVCSMGELFGDWVDDKVIDGVLFTVENNPQHIFQFLTKFPQNLTKWNPWPENAWVGVTVARQESVGQLYNLCSVDAPVRFISIEPMLEHITLDGYTVKIPWAGGEARGGRDYSPVLGFIDWIIIGAQTNPLRLPQRAWVQEIIDAADKAGVPVFLKDNLHWPEQRREWPEALRVKSEAFNHESSLIP